ncbi:sodium/proton antiporter (CPA1 family) [Pseudomonas protegens]|uniref:Na+/H+ antiporter n=1 Tax=Pseudomonas sp. W17 TaxID=3144407 RepID=A0AAU7WYN4_9PSED|nr:MULTISPECIES: Na+/H+ antiporter [Pseudomonas]MCS4261158.1 CPA1 family monovalent cation:H+ antiporter [Pseudomonas sp. BIGb0176]ROQ61277.1 sodium/proton antiporter (CPA1 family) [Pseudomonas protegens]ROQ83595.1 sodium/proton antiporter (CPA1 family) [Pseudomonas protegens]WRV92799.1 Na+/H+ antiporter [Pseudomonas protegens]BAO60557.1 Na+/H+ antiporter [Pseudomonas protegens Cab57]
MQTAYTVLILLMLVSLSRLVGRVIPLPLPLVQIAAGALLAWPTLGLHVALDPELFLFLFLPPLLFSDGWRMPKREFWRLRGPILTLAVGLVLFTVVGAGYFIHWLLPSIPLPVAFALAAVLSPTDAVAVSAISQNRLPTPLMHMLQGEALMNDASGLVTFKFALAAAVTGVFSLANASLTFILVAVGGLAVGVALSWLVGRLRAWMIARGWDDPATHVVFMLLLPFAAYVLAERLGASGILSAVAAGMMQSWLDLLPRQTSTRLLNRSVWSLLEFAFNGLIFLLLGLQLPDIIKAVVSHETSLWPTLFYRCLDVVAIFLVLLVLRFIWVQSIWRLSGLLRRWRGKGELTLVPTARSCWLLTVGGVRGAVTLAGVMSVPLFLGAGEAFPERDLLIFIAAGVILLSLVAACIALPLLLRGIVKSPDDKRRGEVRDAWRKTAEAAIHALEAEEVADTGETPDAAQAALATELKGRLMAEYRHQLEVYNDSAEAQALAFQMDLLERRLRIKALRAQRLELYRLSRQHQIGDDVLREVLADLDMSEANLGQVK